MNKISKFALPLILVFPAFAFAATQGRVRFLIGYFQDIINVLIAVVAAVALLVFFWGLAKFILKLGGDAKAAEDGKKLMGWGLVALFVMVSVWGIVRFIQGEFLSGVDFSNPTVPNIRRP